MKKLGFYLRLTVALLFITAVQLSAQDVVEFPDINTLTPENIFEVTFEPMLSVLIVLFGYLSGFIPGIQKVAPYLRVLAFALIAGLGFHLFGFASVWKVAITYFISTKIFYDGLLKPLTQSLRRKALAPDSV